MNHNVEYYNVYEQFLLKNQMRMKFHHHQMIQSLCTITHLPKVELGANKESNPTEISIIPLLGTIKQHMNLPKTIVTTPKL